MPTRNVVLTDRHHKLIDRLVKAGRYQNASEVLRSGLRLVEKHERDQASKLRALRAAVQVGVDELDSGKGIRFESFEALDAYVAALVERTVADSIPK